MAKVQSDSSQTNQIFSTLQSAIEQCERVSEPSKDNSTTVKVIQMRITLWMI